MTERSYSSGLYLALVLALTAALFGLAWAYTLRDRDAFLDNDYGQWKAKLSLIQSCKIAPTVIVGDSRASAAYVPRLLGIPVTNLALTGATPVETYYEVEKILQCQPSLKAVVFAFSPRQFEEIEWLWEHAARYGLLNTVELNDIADTEKALGTTYLYHNAFGAEPSPHIKNWLYAHHFPPYDFGSIIASYGGTRAHENQTIERETLAAQGQHLVGYPATCANSAGWESEQTQFSPNPLIKVYLAKLVAQLERRGVKIIISSPPYNQITGSTTSPQFKAQYTDFIENLRKEHSNVVVAGQLFPVLKGCFFGDRHHVNARGAEHFSQLAGVELRAALASGGAPPHKE